MTGLDIIRSLLDPYLDDVCENTEAERQGLEDITSDTVACPVESKLPRAQASKRKTLDSGDTANMRASRLTSESR